MLEPIYSAFNLIIWLLSALLWIIWWLLVIIAIITFIGFINVRFYTKNNAEFADILRDEEAFNNSLRSQRKQQQQNKSLSQNSSDSDADSDDNEECNEDEEDETHDTISNPASHSTHKRSRRGRGHRGSKTNVPSDITPTWKMSKRMKTVTAEKKINQQESSPSHSVSSDSTHSIQSIHSTSVSVSVSQTLYNNLSTQHLSIPSAEPTEDINNMNNASHFQFRLTPRMRRKRMENNKRNEARIYSPSPNEYQVLSDENDKFEPLDDEGTPNINMDKLEFDMDKMECFDDLYNFMEQFAINNIKIDGSVKSVIQNFLGSEALKLKSFEQALLRQKLLEMSTK